MRHFSIKQEVEDKESLEELIKRQVEKEESFFVPGANKKKDDDFEMKFD